MNTLEWLPIFLVSMWLFAYYWPAVWAAAIGLIWVLARIWYALAYTRDPAKRGPGFGLQAIATMVLLVGALSKAIYEAVAGG
ncbi:MAG TPA: MAPEG family protein, partial [Caulobacteraceae bacterium]|nr:MAPEG family protein [Caulobacteraceae bacterium]